MFRLIFETVQLSCFVALSKSMDDGWKWTSPRSAQHAHHHSCLAPDKVGGFGLMKVDSYTREIGIVNLFSILLPSLHCGSISAEVLSVQHSPITVRIRDQLRPARKPRTDDRYDGEEPRRS